jgi:hypothetical protein
VLEYWHPNLTPWLRSKFSFDLHLSFRLLGEILNKQYFSGLAAIRDDRRFLAGIVNFRSLQVIRRREAKFNGTEVQRFRVF